jgi:glycosyltransferase involved in cell wall biosynthesis
MKRPWHIAVLIPARDEETLLPRCLESAIAACSILPPPISYDIIVAVDRSTDATFSIAKKILGERGCVISTDAGVVGKARAIAAEKALSRFQGPTDRCWLANTDADCCIPERWLLDQISAAERGVEAITGIVSVDSFEEHTVGVETRFHASYAIFPDGSHPHVHGANLGVRADAYVRAGGWRPLRTAEDHDLWARLSKTSARRESNASLTVVTSGRRIGRAPHGFAEALAAHNEVSL